MGYSDIRLHVKSPAFFEGDPQLVRNVMSLDGFLSSGLSIDRWIADLFYTSEKESFITPFYASCNSTQFHPLDFCDPKLLYCGTNWDGQRFSRLFEILDNEITCLYMAQTGGITFARLPWNNCI